MKKLLNFLKFKINRNVLKDFQHIDKLSFKDYERLLQATFNIN